jgi:glucoamylase
MNAPGRPGIPPRWTSSAKTGVGTALDPVSRVWFTLSHGILNEVYYPRVDQAAIRDLGLIVTDGRDFFSEEKRHARSQVTYLAAGVPAYRVVNVCEHGRYRIEKEILSDPRRDVVLQWVRFVPLHGARSDYHLYALLAPHLDNRGAGNTAWVGDFKGTPMLLAQGTQSTLALASSAPWRGASAGFVGVSDGWQDLARHGVMTWFYDRAEDGNVALVGEVDLEACGGTFVLALGFGHNAAEAEHRAGDARPVQDQRCGGKDARSQDPARGHHCQPLHSLGVCEGRRRPRRLPPGLASRPRRGGRRAAGRRGPSRRTPRPGLPAGHPGV